MIRLYGCFSELWSTKSEKATIKTTVLHASLSKKDIFGASHSSWSSDSYKEAHFQYSIDLAKYYL